MTTLLISSIKQLYRNKEALFWSLLFPLLFIFIFRLFSFEGSISARVIVIDQAQNDVSEGITAAISSIDGIGINTEVADVDQAKTYLEESTELQFTFQDEDGEKSTQPASTSLVIILPEGFGDMQQLAADPQTKFQIDMLYNDAEEGQISPSGILQSVLNQMTNEMTIRFNGLTNPFEVKRTGIAVNEIGYYDILVPGIIGMGLMQSGIIGMAASIAALKEKRVLKRLSATPLPIWKFLTAEVLTHVLLSAVQVTILLILAINVLGAHIYGSIPLIYVLSIGSSFIFLSIGFIAAALTQTANAATSLANIATMPMMFLSGVFFSRDTLPDGVRLISDILPLSPLIDSLRKVSLQQAGIMDISDEILMLIVWMVVVFFIAARVFKFREE